MPLSEKTKVALSLEREEAWRRIPENNDTRLCILWVLENTQWYFRNREQIQRNELREEQWKVKLRFIRPDLTPLKIWA